MCKQLFQKLARRQICLCQTPQCKNLWQYPLCCSSLGNYSCTYQYQEVLAWPRQCLKHNCHQVDIRGAASRLSQCVVFDCVREQAWAGRTFGVGFYVFLASSPLLASFCTQQCMGLLAQVMHIALLHSDNSVAKLLNVATNIGNAACNTQGLKHRHLEPSLNCKPAGTSSIATLHPRCHTALLRSTACTLTFLMAPSPWEAGSLSVPTSVKVLLNIGACSRRTCAVLLCCSVAFT